MPARSWAQMLGERPAAGEPSKELWRRVLLQRAQSTSRGMYDSDSARPSLPTAAARPPPPTAALLSQASLAGAALPHCSGLFPRHLYRLCRASRLLHRIHSHGGGGGCWRCRGAPAPPLGSVVLDGMPAPACDAAPGDGFPTGTPHSTPPAPVSVLSRCRRRADPHLLSLPHCWWSQANVDEGVKGTVLSAFYWGYALSQVSSGSRARIALLGRLPRRRPPHPRCAGWLAGCPRAAPAAGRRGGRAACRQAERTRQLQRPGPPLSCPCDPRKVVTLSLVSFPQPPPPPCPRCRAAGRRSAGVGSAC